MPVRFKKIIVRHTRHKVAHDVVQYKTALFADAQFRLKMRLDMHDFGIGGSNREIIKNVVEDVVANSMDKPYLSVSPDVFEALKKTKDENYDKI